MCGIAGVVLRGGAPVPRETVQAMTDTLAHRGPDGEGVWSAPGVGLGHRRLSIVDLTAAAAQPMVDDRARVALTFNGEIYNFKDVRARLAALGHTFHSTGDTEVLLRALEQWGTAALAHVQGMFAFGYWDAARRELLLARDRYGKKPLYVAPFGVGGMEGVAFASELRALMVHPRVREERAMDPVSVAQYLFHEFVPAPRSILANVQKVRAGEVLRWREGEGITRETYDAPRYDRRIEGSPEMLAEELTLLVTAATRDRLVADVPVGIFLSGGLDSSFVAACAVGAHPHVKTFAIGFEDGSFDESLHARSVATHLGTDHTEERLTAQTMLDLLPSTLDFLDEPFADSSMLPTTLLARLARQTVTVALGGDGGDETLAGYPTFLADRATGWLPPLPAPIARLGRTVAGAIPGSEANFSLAFKAQQFAHGLDATHARRHAEWLAALHPDTIADLAGPRLDPTARAHVFDAVDEAARGVTDRFDAATAFYLRVYLGEGVLTKVDRATMRASLEARAPLLDTRVVEFCLSLPPSMRLRGHTTKWLMRRALRGRVPDAILDRPKKGFGAPIGTWLRGPLEPMLRDTLAPDRLRAAGWIRPEPVQRWIDEHVSGRIDRRKPLYSLLVLEHWRSRWLA